MFAVGIRIRLCGGRAALNPQNVYCCGFVWAAVIFEGGECGEFLFRWDRRRRIESLVHHNWKRSDIWMNQVECIKCIGFWWIEWVVFGGIVIQRQLI